MALTTATIRGAVPLADSSAPGFGAFIEFHLTGWDTDQVDNATVLNGPVRELIGSDGEIEVRLWPNDRGLRGTQYRVTVRLATLKGWKSIDLGLIEVPGTGTYNLEDLLGVIENDLENTWQELAEAVAAAQAAADAANAARDDAADFAGYRQYKNMNALLAETGLSYSGSDGLMPGDIFRTRSEGLVFRVLDSTATGEVVINPSGEAIKLEVVSKELPFDDLDALLADNATWYPAGFNFRTVDGGLHYEVVTSGAHLTTAGGVGVIIADRIATPFHLGAKGDGTDDASALQAFFDVIAGTEFESADVSGTFGTSSALTLGSSGNSVATYKINGSMDLTALAANDDVLTVTDFGGQWDVLRITGTGSTSWPSKTCRTGIRLNNCGRQIFRRLFLTNFAFAGVSADRGNNSLSNFGDVKATGCGSGKVGFSLTGNWSNPSNNGSSGSTVQSTTIDVDQLPPNYITDGTFGSVGSAPFYVRIDGRLHFITSVDTNNSKLNVFPWVASTATPGEFEYVFGGGVYQRGSDCNVNSFRSIDAIRCGTAISAASLYGPLAERIVTQFCGVGILVGREPSGAALGGRYENIYFENNDEDIVLAMRLGSNAYNYFGSEYAIDMDKVYCAGAPRLADDSFSFSEETLNNTMLHFKGEPVLYEKKSRSGTSSTKGLFPTRRDQTLVYYRDTATFNLMSMDSWLNRITGIDSMTLICMGDGANYQPDGTITINAPSGGTVNGGTGPLTYSNLVQPLILSIQWRGGSDDVVVAHLNGAQAAYVGDASSGSAAEINAIRDALVAAGLMSAS